MPRMKLVIPEINFAPKAGQKREITCDYGTTFVKKITMTTTGHFLYFGMVFEGQNIIVCTLLSSAQIIGQY